jgi:hypothetical protein
MPDEPPSQMIRVPTPLVDAVRELSRLHRAGRTKAVLEGIEHLVAAIDSNADIDIASVSQLISKLTQRLERLESDRLDSRHDIDIASVTQLISERLEKVESDIESIALTIADLNVRVSDLEGVGDIGYAVTPLSELEVSDDISPDSEVTAGQQDPSDISSDIEQIADLPADITTDSNAIAQAGNQDDITTDVEQIAEPQPPLPLTQSALAKRLGCSDKAIEKHRKQGSKEQFAEWSRDRDPDDMAWTWQGRGGRGQPLRFIPL